MRKLFAIAMVLTLVSVGATAQNRLKDSAFGEDDIMLNLGYGIKGGVFDADSPFYSNVINPISVSAEYGVIGLGNFITLGVGAYVSVNYAKLSIMDINQYSVVAALRPALHFNIIGILDLGVGVNVGYNIAATHASGDNNPFTDYDHESEFAWAPYASARFMITPAFGIFCEAGFGNIAQEQNDLGEDIRKQATFINAGLSFKF